MKNRVLRTVCGVVLSAMLVITVAIPVLADCAKNEHNIPGTPSVSYPHVSEYNHETKTVISGTCKDCKEHFTIISTSIDPHTPGADGKCTACGYQVWH